MTNNVRFMDNNQAKNGLYSSIVTLVPLNNGSVNMSAGSYLARATAGASVAGGLIIYTSNYPNGTKFYIEQSFAGKDIAFSNGDFGGPGIIQFLTLGIWEATIFDNSILQGVSVRQIYAMPDHVSGPVPATVSVSSAMSDFPAANALDQIRSKCWKPNGNFEITAANRDIYINDGANKTAVMTIGRYSGGAALATQIQTQLNAVSSNWTCTYSTATGKFTVTRTSGTKVIRFSQSGNAIWDAIGFTQFVDVNAPQTSDRRRNHTDEWFKVSFGDSATISAFMEAHAIDGVNGLGLGAEVRLQFNDFDTWSSPAIDIDLRPGMFDRGIFSFPSTPAFRRFARFWFRDRENTNGPNSFSFGNLYFGDYLHLDISNVATGLTVTNKDSSIVTETNSGAEFFLGAAKYRTLTGMEIQNADPTERRAIEAMYSRLGLSSYFFFCLDPSLAVTANLDEATIYGRFLSDPTEPNVIRDVYSIDLELREVI